MKAKGNGKPGAAERIRALASFAPIFRNKKTKFGTWSRPTGSGTTKDPLTMPYFKTSTMGARFQQTLYDFEWVLPKFNWMSWRKSAEAKSLLENHAKIYVASSLQLAKILTMLARADRFSEGTMAVAFANKLLLAIVERAEQLAASAGEQHGHSPQSKTPGRIKKSSASRQAKLKASKGKAPRANHRVKTVRAERNRP